MRYFNRCVPLQASDDIRTCQLRDHLAAPAEPSTVSSLLKRFERRPTKIFELRRKLLVGLISILSSTSVAMADPSSNPSRRHTRHAGEVETVGRPRSFEPPRMIEVRPGWWISTYDCVTDEGQGRWRPCSALGGS
jgi:hypothetical protein